MKIIGKPIKIHENQRKIYGFPRRIAPDSPESVPQSARRRPALPQLGRDPMFWVVKMVLVPLNNSWLIWCLHI